MIAAIAAAVARILALGKMPVVLGGEHTVTGGVVRYVITAGGPEPAPPGRPLPAGIDREHYVEKGLRPIADAILTEIGTSFAEALGEPRQLTLL